MGRYKYDAFDVSQLSVATIDAIEKDLTKCGVDTDRYDWNVLQVRVKRANAVQRHRFADTIRKLHDYLENDGCDPVGIVSFRGFARITGRNVKTVRDWADKGFLVVVQVGFIHPSYMIDLYRTKEKLKKYRGRVFDLPEHLAPQ